MFTYRSLNIHALPLSMVASSLIASLFASCSLCSISVIFRKNCREKMTWNYLSQELQIKIKKKSKSFNRLSSESGNRKKVDIQRPSPRFRSQQFFLWMICGETPCHVGAHLHGHQRNPAETSVTEFCYNSVNLSLEELKKVTRIC